MELAEIGHVKLGDLDANFAKAKSVVASEAARLFGYRLERHDLLLGALKKLRISPLNVQDVEAYKKSKETRKQNRKGNRWNRTTTTTTTLWATESLGDFPGNIPEAVLAKAIEIKKEVPGARFEVEHLVERVTTKRAPIQRRLPDPFLVAIMGKERIYLEVWEEPDFEKTLYA